MTMLVRILVQNINDNKLDVAQHWSFEPMEEDDPTGLVLLHALGSFQNITGADLNDGNRQKN